MRWTSAEADDEVKAAFMSAEVIPITGSFLSSANKDANRYGDLRAGTILPVHFIPRGDERGFSNQDSIIVLSMDYAGFLCGKSLTSAELVRGLHAAASDTLMESEMAARRRCMVEGLNQAPVDLPAGHVKIQLAAQEWVREHWDRLVAPTSGGSTYGCGFDESRISTTGWFQHGPGARRGEQRSLVHMFASPGHRSSSKAQVPLSPQEEHELDSALLPESLLGAGPTPPPAGAEESPTGFASAQSSPRHGGRASRDGSLSPASSHGSRGSRGSRGSAHSSRMSDATAASVAELTGAFKCSPSLARAFVNMGATLGVFERGLVTMLAIEGIKAGTPEAPSHLTELDVAMTLRYVPSYSVPCTGCLGTAQRAASSLTCCRATRGWWTSLCLWSAMGAHRRTCARAWRRWG